MYIDTCSYDDYDRVIRHLLRNGIPILERDKVRMVVRADVSADFVEKMRDEIQFDLAVSFGEKSLG